LKKVLSSIARVLEKVVEGVGGQSPTLLTLGGYPKVHILGDEFYSQGPMLYGDYIAKLALKPFSHNPRVLRQQPLNLSEHPDGIREAVVDFFRTNSAVWDVQVQLRTNLETMPIENASVIWPETESPFLSVARLRMPAQNAWRADRIELLEERMSFSPWHALASHRPLGGIMWVRQAVYAAAARFRVDYNHQTLVEPRSVADLLCDRSPPRMTQIARLFERVPPAPPTGLCVDGDRPNRRRDAALLVKSKHGVRVVGLLDVQK
jgi:hypothetical protein